jgi:hypothetical protein
MKNQQHQRMNRSGLFRLVMLTLLFLPVGCTPGQNAATPAPAGATPAVRGADKPPARAERRDLRLEHVALAEAPFTAEVFSGGKKVETFPVPFLRILEAGDYVELKLRPGALADPVLGVRVLFDRQRGSNEVAPEDLEVTADGVALSSTFKNVRNDEIVFELTYSLDRGDVYTITAKERLRLVIRPDTNPLTWERRPGDYLKPDPLATGAVPPDVQDAKYWIDYFLDGGYQKSYPVTPFERCSRPDDYAVMYFPPGRLPRPVISVQIVKFNQRYLTELLPEHFVVTADGEPVRMRVRQARMSDKGNASAVFRLPKNTRVAVMRMRLPARFQLAVAEKPFDWVADGNNARPPGPQPVRDNGGASVRVSPDTNQPCLP